MNVMIQRIDKFIANYTKLTRTGAKKVLKQKRVKINNQFIQNAATKINPSNDEIMLDNKVIKYQKYIYIALNKPIDYLSATKDSSAKTIMALLKEYQHIDLSIVGRLDKDTTGLILLTNDGDWLHKMTSPKTNEEKEYEVTLEKPLDEEMIAILTSKMVLDGKETKPIKLTNIRGNKCNIILTEGKHHQVKRMFRNSNNIVTKLHRIRVGKYNLQDLNIPKGKSVEIKKY